MTLKLITFTLNHEPRLGAWLPDGIIDLTEGGFPASMKTFIQAGAETWQRAAAWIASADAPRLPAASARLLAPILDPGKIVAIGLNYRDHIREIGAKVPDRPLIFTKFSTSIIGHRESIVWDPAHTAQVDWEVELAVVIGKRARNVAQAEALDYVFGYTIINDVSARDLQFADKQWNRAKSLDTFCPMGPLLVTADEIADPHALGLRCLVNGSVMQQSNTRELVFNIPFLVEYLSRSFTLEAGDIIASGTPGGVGMSRQPPVFLHDGDVVTCEIDQIGALENVCREMSL